MFYITGEMLKRARMMQILLAINILVFIFINLMQGYEGISLLWQDNSRIYNNGEWYRLFTSIFLHANINHLFANCLGLVFFATAVEELYSRWECFLIYIITGFVGSLATLLILPDSISLGASGAIYGFMGAVLLILIVENRQYVGVTIIYLVILIANSFTPGIGSWAHIFGLLAGLIYCIIRKGEYVQKFKNMFSSKPGH
jgi:rhomboid protease GluP